MIVLGADGAQKAAWTEQVAQGRRVFYAGPEAGQDNPDRISFDGTIEYRNFYPWLREIDGSSVLVLDEPLRHERRSLLHYNCIRHYVNQAGAVLIFSYLPIISNSEDFMILFDFAILQKF